MNASRYEGEASTSEKMTSCYYDRYWRNGVGGWHPAAGLSAPMQSALECACLGQTVLDYGGGDGQRYGAVVRAVAERYVVADVSPAVLDARRHRGDEAIHVDKLRELDDRFDTLVMLEVLEHLLDPLCALSVASGLLRPGGTAVVSVPNAFSWWNRARMLGGRLPASGVGPPGVAGHTYDAPHIRFFDLASFRHLLDAAGLRVQEIWTDQLDLGPASRFAPSSCRTVTRRSALVASTLIATCRKA